MPEHVVYRDFAEQTVALNLHTGRYHGLNETSATMLEALREAPTVAAAAQRLAPSWDVDPGVLLADLLDLCDGLESRGLIETHVAPRRDAARSHGAGGRGAASPTRWCAGRSGAATCPPAVAALRARRGGATPRGPLDADERRLAAAAVRVLERLPGDSRCLTRSLVVLAMLARRGIDVRLVLAARPTPTFSAHAWVERGGRPLLPTRDFDDARLAEL